LKAAIRDQRAKSGSVIVLDVARVKCWRW